jgi:hypothetical protein
MIFLYKNFRDRMFANCGFFEPYRRNDVKSPIFRETFYLEKLGGVCRRLDEIMSCVSGELTGAVGARIGGLPDKMQKLGW